MENEILPLVAVCSVIFGVFLSIAKGYGSRPEGDKFKFGKLFSSLIIGVMGSLSISMLIVSNVVSQVNEIGVIALIITFLIQGFGTDQALSKLDK